MDCAVLAGGRPKPEDPIYELTQGRAKAFIPMGSRTMLERVVDALEDAQCVDDVLIVGLTEEEAEGLTFHRPVSFSPDHGSLVANARAGLNWGATHRPGATEMLLVSSDIPLITGKIVDEHVDACRPFDYLGYYTLVTRETMEKRFPHSNRTFVKLKDAEIAGGDLSVLQLRILETGDDLWEALTNARKHAWQLARIVGLPFLIKFLFRRIGTADIEATAQRMLGSPVKVIFSPHAETAMDADKPHQVLLLQQEFNR
ncbi:MAG: NTP transferase domain-containing protein [Ardenticatenaceae bacterium]|nr:nucleotidyltransferase family protein [Anaerolineales bacterium]MCB8919383.1 NTP transferase domain-containing protein [Ardenticatenaceae bacterium]